MAWTFSAIQRMVVWIANLGILCIQNFYVILIIKFVVADSHWCLFWCRQSQYPSRQSFNAMCIYNQWNKTVRRIFPLFYLPHIECDVVITASMFFNIITKYTPYSIPARQLGLDMGCIWWGQTFISVTPVMYFIPCHIVSRNNGTRLYSYSTTWSIQIIRIRI